MTMQDSVHYKPEALAMKAAPEGLRVHLPALRRSLILPARTVCFTLVCFWCFYPQRADARDNSAVQPPVAGRPANFSGGIGSFRVTSRAVPTEIQAEDAIQFTVRVTGSGALQAIQRPDLRRLPSLASRFSVENLGDRFLAKENAREFDYRLRPKSANVKEIPAVPFVFFKPGIVPDYKGYQTTYAPAIPLTVQQRTAVLPSQVEGPAAPNHVPETVLVLAEDPRALRRDQPFTLPGGAWLIVLSLLTLLPGATWYAVWRYRQPSRVMTQKSSKAARQALRALRRLERSPMEQEAVGSANAVIDYLRTRLALAAVEPTPKELAGSIEKAGFNLALAQQTAEFLSDCDEVRFAPGLQRVERGLTTQARKIVLALEAEPWPSQAS